MSEELVSKGVEPMCGWQWVYAHFHDLDGWTPTLEIIRPGSRFTIRTQDTKALNEAVKIINRRDGGK